jgi:hypothetical protein
MLAIYANLQALICSQLVTRDVSEVAQNGAKTVRWYNYSRAL